MFSNSGKIINANSSVIASLKEGDLLGCDADGRLYIQRPTEDSSMFNRFFQKFQKEATKEEASNAIVLATKKYFENLDPKEFVVRYRNILRTLKKEGSILPDDRTKLVDILYHYRHQGLIKSGYDPITAEGILTIEMSSDPEIPFEVRKRISPELTKQGLSGSYFIKNFIGEKIGIYKPSIEEVYMPDNPRNKRPDINDDRFARKGRRQRVGHIAGTSCYKEVLAYELGKDFSGIPFTTLISVPFLNTDKSKLLPKTGSFQHFVPGISFDELKNEEITSISSVQLQRQAAFDLAFGNSDRNFGNGLYDINNKQLHSIDQGLILLDSLNWYNSSHDIFSETVCYWMVFSHVKEPIASEVKDWIQDLDENAIEQKIRDQMASILNFETPPPNKEQLQKYIDGIVITNKTHILFLKKSVEMGFTLYEIGEMVMETKNNSNSSPLLTRICKEMSKSLQKPEVQADPWGYLSLLMDKYLQEELQKKNN